MDDTANWGTYNPAKDSQQAYVDMGQGTVATPTKSNGMTDQQKMFAAQAIKAAFSSGASPASAFAAQRATGTGYQPGGGLVYTGGR